MSPLNTTRFPESLRALEFLLGWAGGWMPIRVGDHITWHQQQVPQVGRLSLPWRVRSWDEALSTDIELGLPRRDRTALGAVHSTILWARVEGREQLQRAYQFKPYPTMVLQEGSSTRRLLIWGLEERVHVLDAQQLNKRIAYRLRAVQKHGDPDRLWVAAPGTCLRHGRSRPTPVVVSRLTTDTYTAAAVAGRLKDPPESTWWQEHTAGRR